MGSCSIASASGLVTGTIKRLVISAQLLNRYRHEYIVSRIVIQTSRSHPIRAVVKVYNLVNMGEHFPIASSIFLTANRAYSTF